MPGSDDKTQLIRPDEKLDAAASAAQMPKEGAGDGRIAPGGEVPSEPRAKRGQSLRPGQKAGLAIAAVCSIALIFVSVLFLVPADPSADAAHDTRLSSAPPSEAEAVKQKADAKKISDEEKDSAVDGEGDAVEGDSGLGGGAAPDDSADDCAPSEDGLSSGKGGLSSGGDPSSSGSPSQPENTPPPDNTPPPGNTPPPAESSTVTISVSVSSSSVGNPVSGATTATFEKGATAYDALMACGLSVNASEGQFGVYVSAIGGLAEKEHGGTSGWLYSVNNTAPPNTASSNYMLKDGDSVSWFYTK